MAADPKWHDPGQLIFYGLLIGAIQRRYPTRLSFFLPVTPNMEDRLLDIEFSKNDFLNMYRRIQDVILKWNKRDFDVAYDLETCQYCPVKNHCAEK